MDNVVIRIENVSKEYRLGVISHGTLSRDLQSIWAKFRGNEDPNSKLDSGHQSQILNEQFWALKDITFDVLQGEIVGIIGRNGAGKSTLLKILSRVTAPTTGSIKIKGRVASLLEVGTGFHPELTGRENVFLNGTVLGMRKGEIEDKFDEIIKFAEIEKFIDTPVKRYSSGMYVRLAFAVAAHLEPEILVVDEVLAVGDAAFQTKCLGKMGSVAKEGRTVLFVSHNMSAIKNLCEKIILLEEGRVIYNGDTQHGISKYLNEQNSDSTSISSDFINKKMSGVIRKIDPTIRFRKITLTDAKGVERNQFFSDEEIKITIVYECFSSIPDIRIYIIIRDELRRALLATVNCDDESEIMDMPRKPGVYESECIIPKNIFGQDRFFISFSLINPKIEHIDVENGLFFDITFNAYTNSYYGILENVKIRPQFPWETRKID